MQRDGLRSSTDRQTCEMLHRPTYLRDAAPADRPARCCTRQTSHGLHETDPLRSTPIGVPERRCADRLWQSNERNEASVTSPVTHRTGTWRLSMQSLYSYRFGCGLLWL